MRIEYSKVFLYLEKDIEGIVNVQNCTFKKTDNTTNKNHRRNSHFLTDLFRMLDFIKLVKCFFFSFTFVEKGRRLHHSQSLQLFRNLSR